MDTNQSINIVKDTFESSFDKGRYKKFIRNLLNQYEEAEFTYTGLYIPDSFKEYVARYERLGKYDDGENHRIDILIVYLKRETSIEHARSMQRNFVAGYLQGKYGSDSDKDAALVAFVSPSSDDWRFSLVKLDIQLETTGKGEMKPVDVLTPARRWSFLVGKHEKSHTAQRQFVPIMDDDLHNPNMSRLEEAFNIEKVTKEFFEKYRSLFIWAKDELDTTVGKYPKTKVDFESKGIDTVNFAKKLLGQIIFLYYLQKKGWFGVPRDANWGEGSRNFLRELFEKKHGDYTNYFNDILEPLFYEALRMDRSYDGHYYSRFNCKIPFLNGGLFDPMNNYDWVKTDILLSNELFSNKRKTKEGDIGDGILDIFDRYNFTVKEDEPFEKEVAIDPELLGKAYEKFNAIRPDNYQKYLHVLKSGKKGEETKFNKEYGVYYTPREIVHYMCQQGLINYLYSVLNSGVIYQNLGDDQLDMLGNSVKVGQLGIIREHGRSNGINREDIAFLILHGESIHENEATVYSKGEETVSYSYQLPEKVRNNAAFIDEKLAEIRVCDPAVGSGAFPVGMMSEIARARRVLEIFTKADKTVYELKRECIENSLYGVDIDPGAVEIAKLRLWLSLVVDEDDPENIKPLPNLDYKIVCGNSLLSVEKNLLNFTLFTELETLKPLYLNTTNPTKKQEIQKKINGLIEQITSGNSLFDAEIYFSEVFHNNGGFDVIIANPPYVFTREADFSKEFKSFISKKYFSQLTGKLIKTKANQSGKINLFALFIMKGCFDLREGGNLNFIVPNNFLRTTTYDLIRKYVLEQTLIEEIIDLGGGVFDNVTASTIIINAIKSKKINGHEVRIMTDISDLEKQQYTISEIKQSQFLKNISYTINIFANQSKNELIEKIERKKTPLGIYCVDIIEGIVAHKHLIVDKRDKNTFPLVEGKTIKRYGLNPITKYIIWKVKEIHRTRPDYLWKSPQKIIIQRISGGNSPLTATLDTDQYKTFASVNNLVLKNQYSDLYKIFLALLNSKVLNWYYANNYSNNSELTVNVSKTFLEQLPIELGDIQTRNKIVHLVDLVLTKKKDNPHEDTSKWENEIDQLVFGLYGLVEDDIKIIG